MLRSATRDVEEKRQRREKSRKKKRRESSEESEVFECVVGRSQGGDLLFIQQSGYVHRGLNVNGMTFHFLQFFPLDIYTSRTPTRFRTTVGNEATVASSTRTLTIEIVGTKNGVGVFVSRSLFVAVLHERLNQLACLMTGSIEI